MSRLELPEKIEASRVVLQRLKYEDAEEIFYTYASKPEATRFLSWPTHKSIDDTISFLRYVVPAWNRGADYTYAVRLYDNQKLIGSFGALHDNGKVQFGYVYSPNYWGRGYATEVCSTMMKLLRRQSSLFRVHTFVHTENVASLKVLLKSGLQQEARLEKWFRFINIGPEPHDCILLNLPLSKGRNGEIRDVDSVH